MARDGVGGEGGVKDDVLPKVGRAIEGDEVEMAWE